MDCREFVGAEALAAVGSAYTLMTFLNSILIGMCMGSGALFSICYGRRALRKLKEYIVSSFVLIFSVYSDFDDCFICVP